MSLALKIKEGKFPRLPKIYSEELWRVIKLMMSSEKEKRPAVEDLLNIPQVSLRLRERRLKESFAKLKSREEEMKRKELKFFELEAKLQQQEKQQKIRQQELEEAKAAISEKDLVIEKLTEEIQKLKEKAKGDTPPLIMSETPKPLGERGFRENSNYDSSSVYNSLKQEIQDLSSQISQDPLNVQCRLKKQASCLPSKPDDLVSEKRGEPEIRKSCLSMKSKLGYKSVERRRRNNDEGSKKTYEYRKDPYTRLTGMDNKENSRWGAHLNTSNEWSAENCATPPFKSYKGGCQSKVSKERVHKTSYRSRSNAYND